MLSFKQSDETLHDHLGADERRQSRTEAETFAKVENIRLSDSSSEDTELTKDAMPLSIPKSVENGDQDLSQAPFGSNPERRNSRASMPVDFTAGSIEGSDCGEDVEKQKPRNERDSGNEDNRDPNLIEWDGPDDPEKPMNWPTSRKWRVTVSIGFTTFVSTFVSSIFSTATVATSKEFGVSTEVMSLGTALLLVGYAFGPAVWGPLSEVVGRKTPILVGIFVSAIFTIPVAVARNVETIFICRFLVGAFSCAPLVVGAGMLNDIFAPVEKGIAMVVFAANTFIGPAMAPVLGGFITQSYLGWRWTQWIIVIMSALVSLRTVPESFGPVILQRRAKRIRYETKNWAIHAKADENEINFKEIAFKYLLKPFKMIVQEPILLLMTVYLSLVYGIIYLLFEAFPISFQEQRGWNSGVGALPFLALLVGVLLGCALTAYITVTRFARIMQQQGAVVPEERLIPMIIGGAIMPAGMFWFAWTSNPNINPWPQILSIIPIGMGIMMIFLQIIVYLVDCYLWQANSAVAANTIVRSLVAAGFVMFATGMYDRLGVPWASSLLGFLCLALFPVPVLFYIYGAKIRKLSKYAPY